MRHGEPDEDRISRVRGIAVNHLDEVTRWVLLLLTAFCLSRLETAILPTAWSTRETPSKNLGKCEQGTGNYQHEIEAMIPQSCHNM